MRTTASFRRLSLATLVVGALVTPPPVRGAQVVASISGRVVNGLTTEAVSGAEVRIVAGGQVTTTQSDADGRFTFAAVKPGAYEVAAAKPGYIFGSLGQRRVGDGARRVAVEEGKQVAGLIVPVWKHSTITGKVVKQNGEPAMGVSVEVYHRAVRGGRLAWVLQSRPARTDDRGDYRIVELVAGEHLVVARAGNNIPVTFHPASATPTGATAIELEQGEARSNVDVQLADLGSATLTGIVRGEDGPASGVLVVVGFDGDAAEILAASTVTDSRGAFSIGPVQTGRYQVHAFPASTSTSSVATQAGFAGDTSPPARPLSLQGGVSASNSVDVETGVNVPVQIAVRQPRTVGGRIEADSATPAAAVPVSRLPLAAFAADGRSVVPVRIDSSGQFVTPPLAAGKYVIRPIGMPNNLFMQSVTLGGRSIIDDGVLIEDSDITDLKITVGHGAIELAGTVRTSAGTPDVDATVLAFPTNQQLWVDYGRDSYRIRAARAAIDGSYRLAGLPPGSYFLVAVKEETAALWQATVNLESLSKLAERVTITPEPAARRLNLVTSPYRGRTRR